MGECGWVEVGRELKKDWRIDGSNETRNQSVRWEWRESRKVQHEKSGLDGAIGEGKNGRELQRWRDCHCLGSLSIFLSHSLRHKSLVGNVVTGRQNLNSTRTPDSPPQPPSLHCVSACQNISQSSQYWKMLGGIIYQQDGVKWRWHKEEFFLLSLWVSAHQDAWRLKRSLCLRRIAKFVEVKRWTSNIAVSAAMGHKVRASWDKRFNARFSDSTQDHDRLLLCLLSPQPKAAVGAQQQRTGRLMKKRKRNVLDLTNPIISFVADDKVRKLNRWVFTAFQKRRVAAVKWCRRVLPWNIFGLEMLLLTHCIPSWPHTCQIITSRRIITTRQDDSVALVYPSGLHSLSTSQLECTTAYPWYELEWCLNLMQKLWCHLVCKKLQRWPSSSQGIPA